MVERLILAKQAEEEVANQNHRELPKSETKPARDLIDGDSVGFDDTTVGQIISVILLLIMIAVLFGLYSSVGFGEVFFLGAVVVLALFGAAYGISEQIYKFFTRK